MENKNKYLKMGFSTILCAVAAIMLSAVPCAQADVIVPVGGELDIDYPVTGDLWVYGTANILPGADIEWFVYATSTSVVNITGGTVGWWIDVAPGADVTVYGTDFKVNGVPQSEGSVTINDTLTGYYENSDLINLTFDCQPGATVTLAAPGGEPLESELWVLPCFINRDRPRPARILTLLRLPEGIAKDDIDSGQPLLLNPGGTEAVCQYAFEWYEHGILRTSIIASFDKAELMAAVPNDGKVELQVAGHLITGQDFCGIQTVTIFSWP